MEAHEVRLEHCFLAIYTIELAMRMLLDWHVVLTDVWVRFDADLHCRMVHYTPVPVGERLHTTTWKKTPA